MEQPAQSQCPSPPIIYVQVAQSCSAWPLLLVQIKNLRPNTFRVRKHNLTRQHQVCCITAWLCAGVIQALLLLTAHFIHRLSTLQEQTLPRACPVPSAMVMAIPHLKKYGKQSRKCKAAREGIWESSKSAARQQCQDSAPAWLWVTAQQGQEELEGTLVSCRAHSRTMHKEILRYFFWYVWDGLGTLKEIWDCFFPIVLFYYFSGLLYVCIGIPTSVHGSWAKQRWWGEVLWAL